MNLKYRLSLQIFQYVLWNPSIGYLAVRALPMLYVQQFWRPVYPANVARCLIILLSHDLSPRLRTQITVHISMHVLSHLNCWILTPQMFCNTFILRVSWVLLPSLFLDLLSTQIQGRYLSRWRMNNTWSALSKSADGAVIPKRNFGCFVCAACVLIR